MALAEVRRGPGIKDRQISPTAGIKPHKLDPSYRFFYDDFKGRPLCAKANGAGACTGTQDDVNLLYTGKNTFEYAIIGTQTVVAPVIGTGGLDFKLDDGAAGSDGAEVTLGITDQSPAAFTVGTDACFVRLKFSIVDQSGMAEFRVGFRKAQAYTHVLNTYTDFATIGFARTNASTTTDIKTVTDLNDAGETTTDTTNDYTENTTVTLEVLVTAGGAVTYKIDGVAPLVTVPFTFDNGDVIVPFIFFIDHTDTPGATLFKEFTCGMLEANVR